jgi:two-component system, chemotaxis family, response regulator WspF
MRISIVNDQQIAIEALKRALKGNINIEISWIAYNGAEAVEKCKADKPDLILMNIIMPVMNGAEATRIIMKENPCPILLVTSSISTNAALVFEAMGFGALDVVSTPVIGGKMEIDGNEDLLKKISRVARLTGIDVNYTKNDNIQSRTRKMNKPILIAIGSSTGGPKALADILKKLPENLGSSIVIVQHVDTQFADGLAKWLGQQSKLDVRIAKDGEEPERNVVHIAASNDHLIINEKGYFQYTENPVNYPYRPSVNEFFKSLAMNWKGKDLAILLTGMGNDGATGLLYLKNLGWKTIAQDEKTSIVYGMPKAAADLGAADEVLPIDKIHESIISFLNIHGGKNE